MSMDLEAAITIHANANPGLAGAIGARFYPLYIPQDAALPAVAYQRISGPRRHDHAGVGITDRARVQFTAQALTYDACKDLAKLVRAAWQGFRGQMGGPSGPDVFEVVIENEMDGYNDEGDTFTCRIDLIFIVSERSY